MAETTDTSEARPTGRSTKAEAVTTTKLQLIEQLLTEAGSFNVAGATEEAAITGAYNKLVLAFRTLFALRGEEFERGFRVFVEQFLKYPKGIYSTTYINRNINIVKDPGERETYVVFINMLLRFARTPAASKANFKYTNNIERLTSRVTDVDLQHSLMHVFLAD